MVPNTQQSDGYVGNDGGRDYQDEGFVVSKTGYTLLVYRFFLAVILFSRKN